MEGLTLKQQRFVDEYLADPELNGGRAYERAGYRARGAAACVGASRLLRNANVAAAIAEAQARRARRTKVSQDWVVNSLTSLVERCMQGEPVVDKGGRPTGQHRFDSTGANRALELLGKHLGMFSDHRESEAGVRPVKMIEVRLPR